MPGMAIDPDTHRNTLLREQDERIARDLARRIHTGQRVEVAGEWTGPDRTPAVCLDRHRALTRWWNTILEQETPRP